MLVTLKDILTDACNNHYAVGAFNVVQDIMLRTVLETAEAKEAPVIVMGLAKDLQGAGWTYIAGLAKLAAEYHRIPICLHLDHCYDLDYIQQAVDHGFTGVMYDGSSLSFEENVKMTRAAVEIAHPHGVSVEAELGHVGGSDLAETEHVESVLTEPDEVTRFVELTGVDALAVSIGTGHGVYRSEPVLNIERLVELTKATDIPLVMHGGSGTPDDQVRNAVANGITKVNVFTEERMAMFRGLKEAAKMERVDPLPEDQFGPIAQSLSDLVAEKIDLLSSDGRAALTIADA
ncbi:MAG: class II fructose-bisphosphate aldolase [Phycisphaerae bacterium]|jgi:fructose-bisphosphate aldolase class II|nr:class II fructose-bisphosphate aldolase [Phycisphaerae bacterium]